MTNWRESQKAAMKEQNVKLKKDESVEVRFTGTEDNRVPSIVKTALIENEYVDTIFPVVSGLLIGSFMIVEGYNEVEKRKYQTSPYFNKKNVVWINDKKKVFGSEQFNVEDAKILLEKNGCNISSKTVVVLATENGIFTVKTNSTLWINQINPLVWSGEVLDYFVDLKAVSFDPTNPIFSKVSPDYYAKMTDKNYPACLTVTKGKYVTDDLANKINADAAFTNFADYKAYINSIQKSVNGGGNGVSRDTTTSTRQSAPPARVMPAPSFPAVSSGNSEDLPF